jgi:cytochrome b561
MALLIITILTIGIYMTEFLPKDAPNHMQIYQIHKSFGVIALIFIFVRIINRLIKKSPALPDSLSRPEKILAHFGHTGLYILMLLVPVSGYLMSNAFGHAVSLFAIKMPTLIANNFTLGKIFANIHELGSYSLLILVIIHILAVVKHRFFDKAENDVLKRML